MMSMIVTVGGVPLKATVDTAAEVTLISDKVYVSLNPRPPPLHHNCYCCSVVTFDFQGYHSDHNKCQLLPTILPLSESSPEHSGERLKDAGFSCWACEPQARGKYLHSNLNIAPIEDQLLLGIDFLRKHGMSINLKESTPLYFWASKFFFWANKNLKVMI